MDKAAARLTHGQSNNAAGEDASKQERGSKPLVLLKNRTGSRKSHFSSKRGLRVCGGARKYPFTGGAEALTGRGTDDNEAGC
jgi:hypothetical protein